METNASLRNYPTSPRKMRLLADVIRGKKVEDALKVLRFSKQFASRPLTQLLLSFRPAPHGRAHRIRKRSNHVTIVLDAETV